jgi:hypothetical protein
VRKIGTNLATTSKRRVASMTLFAFICALYITGFILVFLGADIGAVSQWGSSGRLSTILFGVSTFAFPVVGVLIATRRPDNPIGWLCLVVGLSWGLTIVTDGYSAYGLRGHPGSLPRPDLALAVSEFMWIPPIGLMGVFLVLLFPDGQPPSPRWRPVLYLGGAVILVGSIATLLLPGNYADSGFPNVTNPLGVQSLKPFLDLALVTIWLLPVCVLASAVGLVMRYRRSTGRERLQLRWLVTAVAAVAFVSLVVVETSLLLTSSGRLNSELPDAILVLQDLELFSFALIPIAIGFAILRYRLYDIDLVINRTLVYGSLTLILGGVYVAGVVGLGAVVRSLTVQGNNSLVIAASTLAVAAMFRPARRRIQGFIDRRFYRRKYDAARTLETFSARLREEVDLDSLARELVGVVRSTMQPAHVSLWLRSVEEGR